MTPHQSLLKNIHAELDALAAKMVGEVVNGKFHPCPRPTREHGHAATSLVGELFAPFKAGRGGPGGWVFVAAQELHLGDDIVVPDISGWRSKRYPSNETTPYSVVAPDWICEVLAPSPSSALDRAKLHLYARHGVKHCWYMNPIDYCLEVFELSGSTYIIGPGFLDNALVTAPPFEAHTFDLSVLWDAPGKPGTDGVPA